MKKLRRFFAAATVCTALRILVVALLAMAYASPATGGASAYAQQTTSQGDRSLEETLQRLARDAAKAYVAPAVSGFGSDLNAGWFHRAPRATLFGFDLEFGVVGMGTFFAEKNRRFSTSGIFQFDSSQANFLVSNINDPNYTTLPPLLKERARRELINQIRGRDFTVGISGATIIGDAKDSIRVKFPGGEFTFTDPLGNKRPVTVPASSIALPVGGLLGDVTLGGKNVIPLAAPQLTLGTILGSQFTFRYVPDIQLHEEIGKFKYFGFGIQHNPATWFSGKLPFEFSAGYFTQTMTAGDVFEAKATAFGVSLSKRLGWRFLNITPYAGYMLETSSMKFTYDYTLDTPAGRIPQKIVFELEGENKNRLTLGANIRVLIVNVNADYNIGKFNSVSAAVMISI